MRMRDRISRLEAGSGPGAGPPYVWVWGWQSKAEALDAYNEDLPEGMEPRTADTVTFIHCGKSSEASA